MPIEEPIGNVTAGGNVAEEAVCGVAETQPMDNATETSSADPTASVTSEMQSSAATAHLVLDGTLVVPTSEHFLDQCDIQPHHGVDMFVAQL